MDREDSMWRRLRTAALAVLIEVLVPLAAGILAELALAWTGITSGMAPWRIILLTLAAALLIGRLRAGKRERRRGSTMEAVKVFGPALVLAIALRTIVAEPFVVPTGSMLPTLQIGDHVYASKLDAGLPGRGEIAVFRLPGDEGRRLIKRVVGLPGDSVETRDGRLVINGDDVPRCEVGEVAYMDRDLSTLTWHEERGLLHLERLGEAVYAVLHEPRIRAPDFGPATVPAGHVFVMGDNRDHSWDSRSWGAVPASNLLGHARVIWWSSGPWDEPLRLDRMGHVLGSPAEYEELIGPCLRQLARAD
jgi:signal peptidase I